MHNQESIFDKFTTDSILKTSIIKDRLVETLRNATTAIPDHAVRRDHVNSRDKLGKRFAGGSMRYEINENDVDIDIDDLRNRHALRTTNPVDSNSSEQLQEIQVVSRRT